MSDTLIFIHGMDSSPEGTKARFFKERFPNMLIPHFVGDLDERMAYLKEVLEGKDHIIIVGSSLGGLIATMFAIEEPVRCKRLILLAPAINMIPREIIPSSPLSIPTWIFHGEDDSVIPLKSVSFVATRIFGHLRFYVVKDDHQLRKTFQELEWEQLL